MIVKKIVSKAIIEDKVNTYCALYIFPLISTATNNFGISVSSILRILETKAILLHSKLELLVVHLSDNRERVQFLFAEQQT